MNRPYCGARKVPKGRQLGTLAECLNAGQVRYYGRDASYITQINDHFENKRLQALARANAKRKKAKKSTNEANNLIKKTNVAVRKAKKDQLEAKKAVNEAKNTTAKKASTKKIKPIILTSTNKVNPL